MRVVKISDKEFKVPARYQDKRRVEKEMLAFERSIREERPKSRKPIVNFRKEEFLIPIMIGDKTIIWVRESKINKAKYVKIFGTEEKLKNYILSYKNKLKNETNS